MTSTPVPVKPPEVDVYLAEHNAMWQELIARAQTRRRLPIVSRKQLGSSGLS